MIDETVRDVFRTWIYTPRETGEAREWEVVRMADLVETNVHLSRDLRTVVDEIVRGVVVTNARNT